MCQVSKKMLIVLVYYDNIKLTKIREEGIVMEKIDCIKYVTWGGAVL